MAKNLTSRQREVLDAVKNFCMEKGYPPSIRELGKILGISSLRGVTIHLDALYKKGWIERESTSRSIRILAPMPQNPLSSPPVSIPMLGAIAAGTPLLAVENVESYVTVPPEMAAGAAEMFALRVKGDSMVGDHILDGDTIIIKSQSAANHDEIVAALLGDEATVKRLDLRSNPPRLLPSNPNYEPILLSQDDRILGIVIGLVRSFEAN